PPGVTIDIFFLELVAILSAIHHLLSSPKPPRRILLHTDSLDSVGVLNSLAARTSMHNAPVRAIAGLMLESGADIRVRHLTSEENLRADLLSRLFLDEYRRRFPSNRVCSFTPPRELL
ncbi:hypothetical protein BKA70DRAFT_1066601, partial [Coprinopsis sp. MPI-PUGE-AT-0042]